jgi:hypothetical protein
MPSRDFQRLAAASDASCAMPPLAKQFAAFALTRARRYAAFLPPPVASAMLAEARRHSPPAPIDVSALLSPVFSR